MAPLPDRFADGFDRFSSAPEDYRGGDHVNGIVRGWREDLMSGGPYFLYIHYMDVHQYLYDEQSALFRMRLAGG